MVENRPYLTILSHLVVILGIIVTVMPIWITFVASTHPIEHIMDGTIPMWPGTKFFENYATVLGAGVADAGGIPVGTMLFNSLIMALSITIGKIAISLIAAYAIVYFDFPFRMACFWLIFITLMLPLEVRIVPTYAVAANALSPFQQILDVVGLTWLIDTVTGVQVSLEWNLLNSYTGLILPLIATATGTFLYRQFFMTIPDELVEAAQMDGAGPLRFLWEVLIPLSRTNIAALATIMFVYSWNQYLWPLLIITDPNYGVVAVELGQLVPDSNTTGGGIPHWNLAMAGTLIVMVPPVLVVIFMQRWFVRGLINTDK